VNSGTSQADQSRVDETPRFAWHLRGAAHSFRKLTIDPPRRVYDCREEGAFDFDPIVEFLR
jgi:hypothetical protein